MVRFKIISLYIYKHLRLKTYDLSSYESRDDNNEDGKPSAKISVLFLFQSYFAALIA